MANKIGSATQTRQLVDNNVNGNGLSILYQEALSQLPDATDVTIIVSKGVPETEVQDVEAMIEDSGDGS